MFKTAATEFAFLIFRNTRRSRINCSQFRNLSTKVQPNLVRKMSKYSIVEKGAPNSTDFSIYFKNEHGNACLHFMTFHCTPMRRRPSTIWS
uniref:Uncharacterized protein n=1 Tax=Megaselia scalaris TaxID=36166 RepID=T1GBX9_MEGSC